MFIVVIHVCESVVSIFVSVVSIFVRVSCLFLWKCRVYFCESVVSIFVRVSCLFWVEANMCRWRSHKRLYRATYTRLFLSQAMMYCQRNMRWSFLWSMISDEISKFLFLGMYFQNRGCSRNYIYIYTYCIYKLYIRRY
jgi:hypothetical protein